MSDIRSTWLADLLEHPKGVRNLVTSHRLAKNPSEDSCILEGLCGTLCAKEELASFMTDKKNYGYTYRHGSIAWAASPISTKRPLSWHHWFGSWIWNKVHLVQIDPSTLISS